MGRAENIVEQRLRRGVQKAGGMCLKFISSINGVPDRVVVLAGWTVFVELKSPQGRATKLQRVRHEQMRRAGADVRLLTSCDEVDAFIRELLTHPQP